MTIRPKSRFRVVCRLRGPLTLRFQLSELVCGKNFFRAVEERCPAFLRATCFHAFGLPRFNLCLLVGVRLSVARLTQATPAFATPFAQQALCPANALDPISNPTASKAVVGILIMVNAE